MILNFLIEFFHKICLIMRQHLRGVPIMKKPRLPAQFARKTSDAIAIFKDGSIVYATDSFEELYNHLKSKDKNKFTRTLCDLNQTLQHSGDGFTHQQVVLKPGDREIDISVYLLNKFGSMENHLLILAGPTGSGAELPFSMSGPSRDAEQLPSKAFEKKLSPLFSELIGEDPHFIAVLFKAQKAAQSNYPVLIQGESGTGKEIRSCSMSCSGCPSRKSL